MNIIEYIIYQIEYVCVWTNLIPQGLQQRLWAAEHFDRFEVQLNALRVVGMFAIEIEHLVQKTVQSYVGKHVGWMSHDGLLGFIRIIDQRAENDVCLDKLHITFYVN